MSELNVQIRTANRDRKGEIGVSSDVTVEEILSAAKENWALPSNYEYIVRHERLGKQLQGDVTLAAADVREGDVLEIQQISDAGGWGFSS